MLQKKSGNWKELSARLFRECTERKVLTSSPKGTIDTTISRWLQHWGVSTVRWPHSQQGSQLCQDYHELSWCPTPRASVSQGYCLDKGVKDDPSSISRPGMIQMLWSLTFQYCSIIGTTFVIMIPYLKRKLSATISRLVWVGDYFPRFVCHFGKMTSSV